MGGCQWPRGHFSYVIDQTVRPSRFEVVGLDAGPPRAVGVAVGPSGLRNEFVVNEVAYHPQNDGELRAFLAKYGGTVLRDGTPAVIPTPLRTLPSSGTVLRDGTPAMIPTLPPPRTLPPSGWYLIRVDLQRSPLEDFSANMERTGVVGEYVFSSSDAARLIALVSREHEHQQVGPNFLVYPQDVSFETEILEHPDGKGGHINAANFGWMTGYLDLPKNSLGIGVINAWDYLLYKGIPFGKPWVVPIVAIIDTGFDLDRTTGLPRNGNIDYQGWMKRPLQINIVDRKISNTAGSPVPDDPSPEAYHGQEVFGVAAAFPRNGFGSAGTGGDVVIPMLIRFDLTSDGGAEAVQAAVVNGASVINMSWGTDCFELCLVFHDVADELQGAVTLARSYNVISVAGAGNNSEINNRQFDFFPCTLDNVVCVGGIQGNGVAYVKSGSGQKVAIWAPYCVLDTPDPATIGNIGINALPIFCGTSASSPFIAGIVGLMKALDPSLEHKDVVAILQGAALKSPDPKVTPGYVDAFRAVMTTSPNQPPIIQITSPKDGTNLLAGKQVSFTSSVIDPEQAPKVDHMLVRWNSDRDGHLCTGISCDAKKLSFGLHTITATAIDPYNATASASIKVNAISQPPSAFITYPPNNSTFFTSQKVNLRGFGSSPNENDIPDARLSWSSSLGGQFPTGHDVWVSLNQGTQIVTLNATDALGQTAKASITLTVNGGVDVPTAQILSPQDNASFGINDIVQFRGQGIDVIDGTLPDSSLQWFSSVDGFLGTGGNIMVKLKGALNAPLTHIITLQVTNTSGNQGTVSITVLVGSIG
jgi:hypothetical protein